MWLYCSLMTFWLLIESGGGAIIIFTYVYIDEPTMLQWIVSTPWLTQWATKQKKKNMRWFEREVSLIGSCI